jgi:hypothetical protein
VTIHFAVPTIALDPVRIALSAAELRLRIVLLFLAMVILLLMDVKKPAS